MSDQGSFSFGGQQRSFSFGCLHADRVPTSITGVRCPTVSCEWVMFQNDPASTGNLFVGGDRLPVVGSGVELEPGDSTGWIPISNLNQAFHKEADATTMLQYIMIGCKGPTAKAVLLIEVDRSPLLLEDGQRIQL